MHEMMTSVFATLFLKEQYTILLEMKYPLSFKVLTTSDLYILIIISIIDIRLKLCVISLNHPSSIIEDNSNQPCFVMCEFI